MGGLAAVVALVAAVAAPLDGRTAVLDPGHNGRNAADAERVESPRFRRRIARGIADGVSRFLAD
jgi:N-acetylmuramoyl-L-alanine amidase